MISSDDESVDVCNYSRHLCCLDESNECGTLLHPLRRHTYNYLCIRTSEGIGADTYILAND